MKGCLILATCLLSAELSFSASSGTLLWTCQAGDYSVSMLAPSVADDGTIYITGYDNEPHHLGALFAISSAGEKRWAFKANEQATSPAALGDDGTVYFVTEGTLHSISPQGTQNWQWQSGAYQLSNPAVASDGTIYLSGIYYTQIATNNGLYAIGPEGSVKWRLQATVSNPASPTIGLDGTVYFQSQDRFYAINPNGSQQWSRSWRGGSVIIQADGSLLGYFQANDWYGIAVIDLDGVETVLGFGGSQYNICVGGKGLLSFDGSMYNADG